MGSSMRKKKEKKKDFQVSPIFLWRGFSRIKSDCWRLTERNTETKIESWQDEGEG